MRQNRQADRRGLIFANSCFGVMFLMVASCMGNVGGDGADSIPNEAQDAGSTRGLTLVEGTLSVYHADGFANGTSWTEYRIQRDDGKTFLMTFAAGEDVPSLPSGSVVRAFGTLVGDHELRTSVGNLAIEQAPTGPSSGASLTGSFRTESYTGPSTRKAVILLLNFRNDQSQPVTKESALGQVFTNSDSVNAYYQEQSFGTLGFAGKVNTGGDAFGYYTIDYDSSVSCPADDWAKAANNAATASGVDLSGYDHYLYVFPVAKACGFGSMGQVSGSWTWYSMGSENWLGSAAHELGHNLMLDHSNAYDCKDASGNRVTFGSNCTNIEYGDPFDVMGGQSNGRRDHMNTFQKGRLGFLTAANTQTVTTTGDYTISPLETQTSGVQALRVAKDSVNGVTRYYSFELRERYGFDNFASTDPVVNGVSIHLVGDYAAGGAPHLLDTTPGTGTYEDAALAVGATYTDTAANMSVTVTSISASGAQVHVTMGTPATPPPPSPSPAPPPSNILFSTGFEIGQTAPTWRDTLVGSSNVSGYFSSIKPECSVRQESAHTGSTALMYSGTDNSAATSYAYYRAFRVNIPIVSTTSLSYWIRPDQNNGRFVGIDFHFTDGSNLRDSGATDTNGCSMHPNAGHCNRAQPGVWTQIQSKVGTWRTGKTVDEIWVGYDQPGSTGQYRGYIDDISITQ